MENTKREDLACSVGRALEILNDRWIFLIIREAFFGVHYNDEFQSNLGIATNILSLRLKLLVEGGIFEKQKDERDGRRIQYKLTERGLDLYPITLALMKWGDRWLSGALGPPLSLHHETCGHRLVPVMCCAHCREAVNASDVSYEQQTLTD